MSISKEQMIINTTVPGDRLPIIAKRKAAMMMLTMEQNFKKFCIVVLLDLMNRKKKPPLCRELLRKNKQLDSFIFCHNTIGN